MTALITRDELRAELEAGTVTIVDALGEHYWAKQHLPGALYLVAADVQAQAPRLLPDKSAPIVTYCSNTACPNSSQVAAALQALGYTNVHKYAEGIEDWTTAGLPTESATPAQS